MTLLFYYLAPLQNDTDMTSRCMQFIFGDKGAATFLERLFYCSEILPPFSSESALPVTEKEGKGEGKKSIGSWTKLDMQTLVHFAHMCG